LTFAAPLRVALIGCGDISSHYLAGAGEFDEFRVVSCADLDLGRARALAAEFDLVPGTPEAVLADPDVEVVLNLTPPLAHAAVIAEALRAGKHVYSEKPLATTTAAAGELIALAQGEGLHLACAPDTFLGPPYQAARALIDDGVIGEPLGAFLGAVYGPPERWHPNPQFLYGPGGGPLFDMGPYYLHVLVALLGGVASVRATARQGVEQRTIATGPLAGAQFETSTPSDVSALLELRSGVRATLLASFDLVAHSLPRIEVYGSEATLSLPDPDRFDGPLQIKRAGGDWVTLDVAAAGPRDRRGAGLADLARAIRAGERARLDASLALHAVEVMEGALTAAATDAAVSMTTSCERPRAMRTLSER
jgi:predicted dehydrogenase